MQVRLTTTTVIYTSNMPLVDTTAKIVIANFSKRLTLLTSTSQPRSGETFHPRGDIQFAVTSKWCFVLTISMTMEEKAL